MDLRDLQQHIDTRFDRLEAKVDDHLQRISKAEEAIVWIRGHVTVSITLLLAVSGFFAAAFFTKLGP